MHLDGNGIALVGRKVRRKFGNGYYIGSITHYNHKKWWHVTYDDGDEEDLNCSELHRALLPEVSDLQTAEGANATEAMAAVAKKAASATTATKPKKRKRASASVGQSTTAPLFTQTDAENVANKYLLDFGRVTRPDCLFAGSTPHPSVLKYEEARTKIKHIADLQLVGFHVYDDFLSEAEAQAVLAFCDNGVPDWEARLGAKEQPVEGMEHPSLCQSQRFHKPLPCALLDLHHTSLC